MRLLKTYLNVLGPALAIDRGGIVLRAGHYITADSFSGNPDALMGDADAGDIINKPGNSIPSLFARMLFCRTAFGQVKDIRIQPGMPAPAYNKVISDCLDLLELAFAHDSQLSFERCNFNEQIKNLEKSGNEFFAEALENQIKQFRKIDDIGAILRDTRSIEIISYNGRIIGGTSPFTFVYTSPDWHGSGHGIRSLVEREDVRFREFVYRLYIALSTLPDHEREYTSDFCNYVKRCLHDEKDHALRTAMNKLLVAAAFAMDDFFKEDEDHDGLYPAFPYIDANGNEQVAVISEIPRMYLFTRGDVAFSSDFFLNSYKSEHIDPKTHPLFLRGGVAPSHDMHYYDEVLWSSDTIVPSVPSEDNDTTPRSLPACKAYLHPYLTMDDFLEPCLFKLPYEIDTDKFKCISVPNQNESYLLPLTPMFFRFFKGEDVDKNFEFKFDNDGGRCLVKLRIPVCNAAGDNVNWIEVQKSYSLCEAKTLGHDGESTSFGIFPFYQIPPRIERTSGIGNDYVVMQQIHNGVASGVSLRFFEYGEKANVEVEPDVRQSGECRMHTYRIKQSFDYVQIQMQCDNGGCCGVVIPKFEEVNSGTENLIYAIDFGTTNTHVAYTRSGTVDSHSFSSNEIQHQVAYLNKYRSDAPNMSCGRENAEFLLNRRRRFFPQANEGAYTFPIRSVTYEPKGLDNSSNLFSDGAIGFHITKDITSEGYEPKLKWAFEESVMPTERRKRIDFFFEEILWMVKNHWFKHPATNKGNRPEIVITYPQVMMNRQRMMDKWIEIYGRVFDCDQDAATQKIKELVESFAPCCQLISNGTAVTTGLLNIDIGGATTDLQYYRKSVGAVGLDEVSRYASVLFAGDDLWGVGYENVPECITNNNKNNFTTAAQKVLKDVIFNLEDMDDHASDKGIHEIINDDIPVKQQINKLLQDLHRNFTTWLSDNTTNVCRQTLFLHYSAIVYYVGLWIRDNTSMSLPATLNFTGMGAKYITLLFQNNELLTRFTRTILERVVGEKFNDGFSLDFDKNPKNVTAEGASAYFAVKKDFAENKVAYHAGGKTVRKPMVSDLKGREEETMAAFEAFVNLYQDLPGEIGGVTIPKLRGADKERLISNGRISLGEMITKMNERAKDSPEAKISDTMFFWPLKGSLYNLGN